RELAPTGAQPRAERDERSRHVRGMRRGAEPVREDRVLAMLAVAGVTPVPAVQTTRVVEPPVPAASRLEEVATERAHVAKLWRGREPARLPQRIGDRRLHLKLRERRAGTDHAVLHTARHETSHVDEPLRL